MDEKNWERFEGKMSEKDKEITYRGYKIIVQSFSTRFGRLYRAWIDNGEPIINEFAYNTEEEAISASKSEVNYLRYCED